MENQKTSTTSLLMLIHKSTLKSCQNNTVQTYAKIAEHITTDR